MGETRLASDVAKPLRLGIRLFQPALYVAASLDIQRLDVDETDGQWRSADKVADIGFLQVSKDQHGQGRRTCHKLVELLWQFEAGGIAANGLQVERSRQVASSELHQTASVIRSGLRCASPRSAVRRQRTLHRSSRALRWQRR
eukprot:449339-Rhodomonas_salina.1